MLNPKNNKKLGLKTSVLFFIETCIKGGVIFLLPFVFAFILVQKIIKLSRQAVSPLADKFGIENFAGRATIWILMILFVLLVCFVSGLLIRVRQLKKLNEILDNKLSKFAPEYVNLKKRIEAIESKNAKENKT